MLPTVPSWFKGRQGNAEEAGPDTVKLTAPNVREAYLTIRRADNGRYVAAVRYAPDGEEIASSKASLETPTEAWDQAFELYRTALIDRARNDKSSLEALAFRRGLNAAQHRVRRQIQRVAI